MKLHEFLRQENLDAGKVMRKFSKIITINSDSVAEIDDAEYRRRKAAEKPRGPSVNGLMKRLRSLKPKIEEKEAEVANLEKKFEESEDVESKYALLNGKKQLQELLASRADTEAMLNELLTHEEDVNKSSQSKVVKQESESV